MQIIRTFDTRSSSKYLKTRTVSIPTSFYDNVGRGDIVKININAGYGQLITIESNYTDLRQRAKMKSARGQAFYVLPY